MPISIEYDSFECPGSSAIARVAIGTDGFVWELEVYMRKRDKTGRRRVYGYLLGGDPTPFHEWKTAPSKGRFYVNVIKKKLDYAYKFNR